MKTTHSAWTVFMVFLRLGLTSFGGPVAHLAFFREELVARRQWLSERQYADLVALCQFLPGPASSQVGLALGLAQAGYRGALAAWLGFTLPSALLLVLLALGLQQQAHLLPAGVLHGLKLATVAVVAQAVWGMARQLCPDTTRRVLMLAAAAGVLWWPTVGGQMGVLVLAALAGLVWCRPAAADAHEGLASPVSRRAGAVWLAAFGALLLGLPLWVAAWPDGQALAVFDAFYRAGALVFGGGHVVLPLLQAQVVPTGWVDADAFVAGYAAAQAVPGPLFTFAAFLGASMGQALPGWSAWLGGLWALLAIFLPAFLLVAGALPFWAALRCQPRAQAALQGVNAAVVGLLLATWVHPLASTALASGLDVAWAALALMALQWWRRPAWQVVAACALLGAVVAELG